MLPLITNVVPQNTASQANMLAAAQSAFQTGQANSASRQITAVAVSATGAAAAFTPQLPERRTETTQRANLGTPQPDRPAILPDPDFWKVPTREASPGIPQLPARVPTQPAAQPVTQFNAQAVAQQQQAAQQQEAPQPEAHPLQQQRRFNALAAKKPGVGDSTGHGAYAVANQRNHAMSLPSTHESVI